MTDLQVIEAAEELASAADKAPSPREFPMLSADQLMRLCALARRGLRDLSRPPYHEYVPPKDC